MDIDEPSGFIGPLLPGSYLRVIPHPSSPNATPIITPIDSPGQTDPILKPAISLREDDYRRAPWFPFRSRADFSVTEIAVNGTLSNDLTNSLLGGASGTWISEGRSDVTLKNRKEMESVLASARKYGVRVSA